MNEVVRVPLARPKSVVNDISTRYGMEPDAFEATVLKTCINGVITREEFAAFLLVANEYKLNPLTKEIYAFPKKGGGIVPVVSIDGWMNLINSNPAFDGMEFEEAHTTEGELLSTKCTIYRKDRAHPTSITEYIAETRRDTEPWKMKHRMNRHKAAIQCARYAFGFAGIYEEDEAERIAEAAPRVAPTPPRPAERKPVDAASIEHEPAVEMELAGELIEDAEVVDVGSQRTAPIPPRPPARAAPAPVKSAPAIVESFDPERTLQKFKAALDVVTSGEDLGDIWEIHIEAHKDEFFPPDYEAAQAMYRRAEERLAP